MSLRDLVEAARAAYYSNGESWLTDDEYDSLKSALDLPTYDSSAAAATTTSEWAVVPHVRRMTGIPKLDDWVQLSSSVYTSLKYDGLAVELVYSNGLLTRAVLRGDGDSGEDITSNVMRTAVPKKINDKRTLAVYGEIVVSWNNLDVINEMREDDGLPAYKTPRNAVAAVRARTSHQIQRILPLLAVKAYWAVVDEIKDPMSVSAWLAAYGFDTAVQSMMSPHEARETLSRLEKAIDEKTLRFQVDGIVIRDGNSVWKVKPTPKSAVATVKSIIPSLGRTGIVCPVVEFEPVTLGGVTVKRATAHNVVRMGEHLTGIGPGAVVSITRRGDVIPHIERVLVECEVPWTPPSECPSCGSELKVDGSTLRCSADPTECTGTAAGLLLKFCRAHGVDGMGPSLATALVASGMAADPSGLFTLDADRLADLPIGAGNLGIKTATKFIDSLWESAGTVTMGQLLGSLGIPRCAGSVMDAVAAALDDFDQLKSASTTQLSSIPGVGPVRATAIASWLANNADVLDGILEHVNVTRSAGPLAGMTFCITLGLSEDRSTVESQIRLAGGRVKSSVTREVTHLVCNYPDDDSTKLRRARSLNVPIISEKELRAMMHLTAVEEKFDDSADF